MEDIIDIIVTETTNLIEITSQPNDEIIDVNIIDNREDITLNVTPSVVEININSLVGNFGVNWGQIGGTLSNQTDLQTVLNAKADLVGGLVPSSQLPSFVDDVIEVATFAALPVTGEQGKIYVVLATNLIYRWSGSAYIEIKDSSAVWGAITGSLSSQIDLQNALDAKLSLITAASTYVDKTNNQSIGGIKTFTSMPILTAASGVDGQIIFASASNELKTVTNFKYNDTTGVLTTQLGALGSNAYSSDTFALDSLVVKLAGSQTITGTKTFQQAPLMDIGVGFKNGSGVYNYLKSINTGWEMPVNGQNHNLIFSTSNNYVYTFPNASGTIALTSDLHNAVTIGMANGLSLSGQVLSLGLASSIAHGALSFTDWAIFNAKQTALNGSGFVKISGTTISYDNSTYLTTASAASTYLPLSGGTITGNLFLPANNTVGGTNYYIGQTIADNDYWRIYGNSIASDQGELVFHIGDNAQSSSTNGQRFRFYYDNVSGGIAKDALIIDYNTSTFLTTLAANSFIRTGGTSSQFLKADGSVDSSVYALDSAVVKLTGNQSIAGVKTFDNNVKIDGDLYIKQDSTFGAIAGYNAIATDAGGFYLRTSTSTIYAYLAFNNLTTYQNFSFPNSTGTLALTSDLNSYLLKTGGTLTGALSGTSATFSGNVSAGSVSATNGYRLKVEGLARLEGANTVLNYGELDVNNVYFQALNAASNVSKGFVFYGTSPYMTITSSGNVGIGTTAPNRFVSIQSSGTADIALQVRNTGTGTGSHSALHLGIDGTVTNAGGIAALCSTWSTSGMLYAGGTYIYNNQATGGISINSEAASPIYFGTNNAERMRITSDGRLLVGTTSTYDARVTCYAENSSSSNFTFRAVNTNGQGIFSVRNDGQFRTGDGSSSPYNLTVTGRAIFSDSSGVLGYLASVREAKTNINSLNDISWLYNLNPVIFNYRKKDFDNNYTADFYDENSYGLIADEVEKVNKDLVFYDSVNGKKELRGVEYDKLVPALLKAMQELKAELDILKNK